MSNPLTPEDPTHEKTFTIELSGMYSLTVDEIWPDGDAPENPTVDDVIATMIASASSTVQLAREWDLDVETMVEGRTVFYS